MTVGGEIEWEGMVLAVDDGRGWGRGGIGGESGDGFGLRLGWWRLIVTGGGRQCNRGRIRVLKYEDGVSVGMCKVY